MGDEKLLERACAGDEDAFRELFDRFQGRIYRYAAHVCGPETGDDVVQETFLAVLRQNNRYDSSRGTLVQYLFGIARHLVSRHLASRYPSALSDRADDGDSVVVGDQGDVLDCLSREETIDAVRAAVRSLPPLYREVVVLCDLQDMDYADAAGLIGCPVGTVRSRLHRARALLTTRLASLQPAGCGEHQD